MHEHSFEFDENNLPKANSTCLGCDLLFEDWLFQQLPEEIIKEFDKSAKPKPV